MISPELTKMKETLVSCLEKNNDEKPEVWTNIRGFGGRYSVSNQFRVRSNIREVESVVGRNKTKRIIRPKILTLKLCRNGIVRVDLVKDGRHRWYDVAKLVSKNIK